MDSLDLLAREDEFKKLNKQLEKRTEKLMKEIEHVMQKPDFFSDFSHSLALSPKTTNTTKKHCCDTPKTASEHSTPTKVKPKAKSAKKIPQDDEKKDLSHEDGIPLDDSEKKLNNSGRRSSDADKNDRIVCDCYGLSRKDRLTGDLEFLYAFVSVNVQEKVLPQTFLKERATVESVCKFLSSKVKLMQEQIDKLQDTINKKGSQCEVHLTKYAELEGERMAILNKNNSLRASAADMKVKWMATQKKLEEKERLYKEHRSEADKLSSEVKRLRSKNASVEARCASQEEAIDNLKHQVEMAKRAEKEYRDSTRTLSTAHDSAISRLQSQIKAQTLRIDKQHALIDNLRRQNTLLCSDAVLKALEKDYCRFLTQDL